VGALGGELPALRARLGPGRRPLRVRQPPRHLRLAAARVPHPVQVAILDDARPGNRLVAAIDLRGRYREPFSNWEAATDAPSARLRADLELLPAIAERGLAAAAKDISQGGLIGTAMMLAECSGVGATIELPSLPRPESTSLERWLQTFPSYGYVLAVDAAVHLIEKGKAFPVCGNTWRVLADTRFRPHFEFIGDFGTHYGIFPGCGTSLPFATTTAAPSKTSRNCC